MGGPSAPILSYIAARNFLRNAKGILTEGYRKVCSNSHTKVAASPLNVRSQYHGSVFKVATLDHWLVVASGLDMIEDIRKRPDDQMSFSHAIEESLLTRYTVGAAWIDDPYHIHIIRERLMRTLPVVLPDVLDELKLAIPHYIPARSDGKLSNPRMHFQ